MQGTRPHIIIYMCLLMWYMCVIIRFDNDGYIVEYDNNTITKMFIYTYICIYIYSFILPI